MNLILGYGHSLLSGLSSEREIQVNIGFILNALNNSSAIFAVSCALYFFVEYMDMQKISPRINKHIRRVVYFGVFITFAVFFISAATGEVQIFNPISKLFGTVGFGLALIISTYIWLKNRNVYAKIYERANLLDH